MAKKQSEGLLFDTLKKVGKHRERIGAKAQKQVEKPKNTTPTGTKNKNKAYTPPKKSKAQGQKELEALRKKQAERVSQRKTRGYKDGGKVTTPDISRDTPKSDMPAPEYPKPKKILG